MRAVRQFIILFASWLGCWVQAPVAAFQGDTRPYYTAASIVNAATNTAGPFAPNTIITIYGTHLAFDTIAVSAQTIASHTLPTELGGVHVVIDGLPAGLYYVSPGQINLLIPNSLLPGVSRITVARDGVSGPCPDGAPEPCPPCPDDESVQCPSVPITLGEVAPGLFADRNLLIAATHANGAIVSAADPVTAGEWVVLYCVGLGRTAPDLYNGEVAVRAMPAVHWADLSVLVGGSAITGWRIYYAGVTPGYAGLYQINVKLPDDMAPNPEVRFAIGARLSPPSTYLVTR